MQASIFSLSALALAFIPFQTSPDDPDPAKVQGPPAPASPTQWTWQQPRPNVNRAIARPAQFDTDLEKSQDTLPGYHIIVSAGQSNTHFGFGTQPSDFIAHPRVYQQGRHGNNNLKAIPGREPFEHWTSNNSNIGHAKIFAERYIATLAEDQKVLVIPGGCAGSGLGSGVWMPGGAFFEDLIYRVQHALWNFPGSEVRAVLWHQGEDDVFNSNYLSDLLTMIPTMRQRFEVGANDYTDLPFLLGGFSDAWVATNGQFQLTENLIQSIPYLVPHTAYVSSDGLGFNHPAGYAQDLIHINAAGQREFGHRYFSQLEFARNNNF